MASVSEARRAREKRQRRESILDAAERVFRARGIASATMEDIAEEAELSKGALYLYFASKDDLFLALSHRPLDAVLVRFRAVLDEAGSGMALLGQLIEAHTEVLLRRGAMLGGALANPEMVCPPPSSALHAATVERIRQLRAVYRAVLERGMRDGSVRADIDPGRVSTSIWGALFGATFIRARAETFPVPLPDDEVDLTHLVPDVASLLLRALEPRPREPALRSS